MVSFPDAEIAGEDEEREKEKRRRGETKEPLCPRTHGAVLAPGHHRKECGNDAGQRADEKLRRFPVHQTMHEIHQPLAEVLVGKDDARREVERANEDRHEAGEERGVFDQAPHFVRARIPLRAVRHPLAQRHEQPQEAE